MSRKKVLSLILLLVVVFLFWSSAFLQNAFNGGVNYLEEVISQRRFVGVTVFVALAALSAILSPFSSVPLVPAAILIWEHMATFVYLLLGWFLGGVISYAIGRHAAYPLLKHLIPFQKIEYYQNKIPPGSQFWVVLLFRLALPSEIAGYVLGALRYHFGKYNLATFLAELPFAFIAVFASDAFVDRRPALFISMVILTLLLVGLMLLLLKKYLRK